MMARANPEVVDDSARPAPPAEAQAVPPSGGVSPGPSSQPVSTRPAAATRGRLEGIREVLLIRLRRIGDVVTVTPCTRAVKETFPEARLSVLVEKASEEVMLGNPYVDEVIVLDKKKLKAGGRVGTLREELKFLLALRRKKFDLTINLHGGPRSTLQTLFCGATYRLGGFIDWHHWNWVYNIRTRPLVEMLGENGRHSHIVERHLATLKAAGIETSDHSLVMTVSQQAQASLDRLLKQKGASPNAKFVTIHPVSRSQAKCWRAERFAELADRLIEDFGATVVLVSGPGEEAASRKVQEAMRRGAVDLGGRVSLQELGALVSRSSLYIGLDSGALHVAAAMEVPMVALFGPTSDTWRPWTDHGIVVRGPVPCRGCVGDCPWNPSLCMDGIGVAHVWDAILRLRAAHGLAW